MIYDLADGVRGREAGKIVVPKKGRLEKREKHARADNASLTCSAGTTALFTKTATDLEKISPCVTSTVSYAHDPWSAKCS